MICLVHSVTATVPATGLHQERDPFLLIASRGPHRAAIYCSPRFLHLVDPAKLTLRVSGHCTRSVQQPTPQPENTWSSSVFIGWGSKPLAAAGSRRGQAMRSCTARSTRRRAGRARSCGHPWGEKEARGGGRGQSTKQKKRVRTATRGERDRQGRYFCQYAGPKSQACMLRQLTLPGQTRPLFGMANN